MFSEAQKEAAQKAPHKTLQNSLKRARRALRDEPGADSVRRQMIISAYLMNTQDLLQLSNTQLKLFLRQEGVNLVTVRAHGHLELRKMLRKKKFRVPKSVAKRAPVTKRCLVNAYETNGCGLS